MDRHEIQQHVFDTLGIILVDKDPIQDDALLTQLELDEEDFREFNRACGPFWFLLTDDSLSWAISCNNAYNLYAAGPPLLERLLNKSISKAREEFRAFAVELAHGNADYPPLRMAEHYEGV